VTFTDDIADVVDTILAAAEATHGRPDQLDRKDRLVLIRELDQRGVFNVRNAAQRVASHLGISRASLYADLQGVRGKEAAERQTA
jgi:predicted transcriptional regulator YheO